MGNVDQIEIKRCQRLRKTSALGDLRGGFIPAKDNRKGSFGQFLPLNTRTKRKARANSGLPFTILDFLQGVILPEMQSAVLRGRAILKGAFIISGLPEDTERMVIQYDFPGSRIPGGS